MRAFRECVFNDTIMGTTTVYTSTKWNRLLASSPNMVIQAVAANVVSPGAPGKLSIHLQISSDGRNWLDKYSTPEIDDADQSEGAVTTTVGHDDGTEPSMSQARLEITTSGNTEKMHLKLWVTGRVVVPGSARQAVAARRAAALRAEQAQQQRPAPAPPAAKAEGCGGSCRCGGSCSGAKTSGASIVAAPASLVSLHRQGIGSRATGKASLESLTQAGVPAQGRRPEVDRRVAARAARFARATPMYQWSEAHCHDAASVCNQWCGIAAQGNKALLDTCNSCCQWKQFKCLGQEDNAEWQQNQPGFDAASCGGFPIDWPRYPRRFDPGLFLENVATTLGRVAGLGPPPKSPDECRERWIKDHNRCHHTYSTDLLDKCLSCVYQDYAECTWSGYFPQNCLPPIDEDACTDYWQCNELNYFYSLHKCPDPGKDFQAFWACQKCLDQMNQLCVNCELYNYNACVPARSEPQKG